MQRVIRALLIILAVTGCASVQTAAGPGSSADSRLETTSASHGITSADRAPQHLSADTYSGSAEGPKTERAIGIVGLAAEVAALTILFIAFYKLATMLPP